jgi:hypothetical protein
MANFEQIKQGIGGSAVSLTAAQSWYVSMTDGTNVLGTVTNPVVVQIGGGGGDVAVNLAELNAVALGSPSTYGTSPGAVNVIGVNAYVTGGSVTVSGSVGVTQSTSPWIVAGGGTAGSPGTAVLTVQGIASGTAIPISIATGQKVEVWDGTNVITVKAASTTSVAADTSLVTQISPNQPTSNMTGQAPGAPGVCTTIVGGLYSSTLPTATNGQSLALSLDAKGQILTDLNYVGGAAVSTATSGVQLVGVADGSGNKITSTSNALDVNIKSTTGDTAINVAQFGGSAVVTGTGTSGAGIPRVTVSNDSNILATQSGTWNVGVSGATPPAVVQTKHGVQTNGTSLAITPTSNMTTGNTAIVIFASDLTLSSATVTDTAGSTYHVTSGLKLGGQNIGLYWAFANIAASGSNTITINTGAASNKIIGMVYEMSGLSSTQPLDAYYATVWNLAGEVDVAPFITPSLPGSYAIWGILGGSTTASAVTYTVPAEPNIYPYSFDSGTLTVAVDGTNSLYFGTVSAPINSILQGGYAFSGGGSGGYPGFGLFSVSPALSGTIAEGIVYGFALRPAAIPVEGRVSVVGTYGPFSTLNSGDSAPLQIDQSGNLLVNVKAGVSTPPANGATSSPVPADADYIGLNVSGNLKGATGLNLTNAPAAMQVAIVDSSGTQITSFGGGTQYVTGTYSAAPTGTMAMGWANSTNKAYPINIDTSGNQYFYITDGTNLMGPMTKFGTAPSPSTSLAISANVSPFIAVGSSPSIPTGVANGSTVAQHMAVVDTNGHQISSNSTSYSSHYGMDVNLMGTLGTAFTTAGKVDVIATGTLTNNNAAPSTNNVGVLPAVAKVGGSVYTNGNQVLLNTDLGGDLLARFLYNESPLGDLTVAERYNQFEINFSSAFNSSLITNTSVGGGTYTQANGCATYATSTGTTDEAKGVSVQSLVYSAGHSWYALFTASFTAGKASSHQRVGPYNSTDGFWLGWEGATFGFTQFQNGSASQTAKASWNGDPLDGSSSSKFTKNGSPLAIDLTKINIWRIDGAWFGVSPIRLSVYSPDGNWVTCHTFTTFTGQLTTPFTYSTNWNFTIDVANAGNNTALAVVVPCMAMGTTDVTQPLNSTLTDYSRAQDVRAIIAGKNPSGTYTNVAVSADNALEISGSGDTNVAAATWTSTTASLITAVGGNTNTAAAGTNTVTVTYSPTAGNTVVVSLKLHGAVTGLTVKDSHGTSLTAGPTVGNFYTFYQLSAASGTTGFVAAWTTNQASSMAVEEYSGVNAVNAALSGNTANATSATASITVTPNELGDVVVGTFGAQDPPASNTFTSTVGSQRQNITANQQPLILSDSTSSPATITATLTSAAWWGAAIGLRPTISGGTALNTTLLMLNNSFNYNSVAVQLVGSGTILGGTIAFEVSIDDSNWVGISGINSNTGATQSSPVTLTSGVTGLVFNVTGYNYFRARLASQIAGYGGQVVISYNVQGLASPNVSTTITGSITTTGNQGTPNTIGNAWPVLLTDGSTSLSSAFSAYGTAPTGTEVMGVNAYVTNTSIAVTGTVTANISGSISNTAFGANLNDGAGNAITSNSTTTSSKRGIDTNILSILGTAPTTAGFLDIKGADGNVYVRSNSASTFPTAVYAGSTALTAQTGGYLNTAVYYGTTAVSTSNGLPIVPATSAIFEVSPTTAANTKTNPFFFSETDGANVETASFAAWGTKPTGTYVNGVNAEIFVGSNAVSATYPMPVSATAAANTGSNPIYTAGGLTHNNAAPTATNIGVLPAIANQVHPTFNEGDQVLLTEDLSGNLRVKFNADTSGNASGTYQSLTAVDGGTTSGTLADQVCLNCDLTTSQGYALTQTAWGTATASTGAIAVNASLAIGATMVSATHPVPISATAAANAKTNPIFDQLSDGTNQMGAMTAYGTAPSGYSLPVNAYVTNTVTVGGSVTTSGTATVTPAGSTVWEVAPTSSANTKTNPFFFSRTDGTNVETASMAAWGTAPTGTYVPGTNAELFVGTNAVSTTHPVPIQGTLTHNNAAPTSNNIGALVAECFSSGPTYTAGDQVLLNVDTNGLLRTKLNADTTGDLGGTYTILTGLQGGTSYTSAITNAYSQSVDLFTANGKPVAQPTWGTSTTSVLSTTVGAIAVNASLFTGTTAVSASAPLPVTATGVTGPVQTGNAPTYATVGVTSATALAANASRTALILTNTSSNTISLGFGSNAAVLYSGITLYAGGSAMFDVMDNIQQAITAIASGASSNLAIQEFN